MKFDFNKNGDMTRLGKKHQRAIASEIAVQERVAPRRSRPIPGGSLSQSVRSLPLRTGPWGFSVLLSKLGVHLSRFTMGNRRQRARPITVALPVREFVFVVKRLAVEQMEARDREVR